jgi:hypothetical protein
MIAMLLAAQLTATAAPQGLVEALPPRTFIAPARPDIVVRLASKKTCGDNVGRLEASLGQPTALYRTGDRPAKGLRDWVDYPNGAICLVETGQ